MKRRSRVVQVLPSTASLIRLVGAVLTEQNEDRSMRGYFNDSSMLKAFEQHKSESEPYDIEEIARKAATIIEIAKDENVAIEKRAA